MTEMNAGNAGPITFEDVQAALAEQDPAQTNAGALRKLIGRGSLSTIQKHLDTLRAQAVQPAAPEAGEVPKPPADLVQSLWAQAWASAQAMVQTALASALAKCEALAQALGLAQADAVAAQAEADQARDELVVVVARLDGLEGQHKAELEAAQQQLADATAAATAAAAAAQHELATMQADAVHVQQQLENKLSMATARYDADLALLRGELDRHVSQLADLRSALHHRPTNQQFGQ